MKLAVLAFVKYPVIFCGYMAAGIFRNLVISISRSGICRYPWVSRKLWLLIYLVDKVVILSRDASLGRFKQRGSVLIVINANHCAITSGGYSEKGSAKSLNWRTILLKNQKPFKVPKIQNQ